METADGWISAPPLPGALVVNIGELLELASNGYLKATLHRVQSPPPGVSRLSCAFFMAARLDATVPLLSLSPRWRRRHRGPRRPDQPALLSGGENVLKGRLRSHPDVAARHYGVALASANAQTSSEQMAKARSARATTRLTLPYLIDGAPRCPLQTTQAVDTSSWATAWQ